MEGKEFIYNNFRKTNCLDRVDLISVINLREENCKFCRNTLKIVCLEETRCFIFGREDLIWKMF